MASAVTNRLSGAMIDFCRNSNRASKRLDMIPTPTELLYRLDWEVLPTVVAKLWRHRGAMWRGWYA
jgi:hypothetical protein